MNKKISFLLMTTFLMLLCAQAQEKIACKINDQKNDYVIYSDNRSGNTILGIMLKGNNTYIVRKYNIDTNEELVYRVSYTFSDTPIKSNEFVILKGKDTGDYSELMDFTLIIQAKDKVDNTVFPSDVNISQEYGKDKDKRTRQYTFKYWVPVLNLFSIDFGDKKKLQLVDMGRSSENEDQRFYSMNSWPKNVNGPSYPISKTNISHIKYDQCALTLDRNWKQDGNDLVLAMKTPRDAQIAFDNYNIDPTKGGALNLSYIAGALKVLSNGVPIIAESLKIGTEGDCLIFDYYVYNPDDKMSTHIFDIYKIISPKKIDNVTIYSYATLYQDNMDYFTTILKSIISENS